MDARHLLQERENRTLPQHLTSQLIREGLPQRRRFVLHQGQLDLRLHHAFVIISTGQTDVQFGRS